MAVHQTFDKNVFRLTWEFEMPGFFLNLYSNNRICIPHPTFSAIIHIPEN